MSQDHSKIIKKIAENYIQMEQTIVKQLEMESHHNVTMGSFREEVWKAMFTQIIPKKFSIERSVFIIDSEGTVSNEVDLAIFDEQYTPYIFNYGQMKFIPVEAVAAVVQCKSETTSRKKLESWVDSITDLKTSLRSIARMHSYMAVGEYDIDPDGEFNGQKTTQTATRPIRILCHTNEKERPKSIRKMFDLVIGPEAGRLKVTFSSENSLLDWYNSLNHANKKYQGFKKENIDFKAAKEFKLEHYKVFQKNSEDQQEEIALLSLTFQLNQMLMLVNNPILFPHLAYVEMFNNMVKDANE
ncbi:DUF6602 domain-containing protein [Paenibacillus sp. GCM10012307]|uniref:DUF6602 domain-containing protein n=1 Tax=Paenibacillus roseus TaxID=2798579 RepID=A0A934JB43_9BACL|nr:DUF6602 domain-containing protein [Paenibacillus roseus]MBJ6363921.1 hypothetical protein [Paenibacillus roseus]